MEIRITRKRKNILFPCINGYQLTQPWSTSGSAQWSFAEKDNQKWFIKQFIAPKFKRESDGVSKEQAERARIRCENFRKRQEFFYGQIRKANTGNVVPVTDFFSFGTYFYAVSPKIDDVGMDPLKISGLSAEQRHLLMKILSYNLTILHQNGIVHADLKPDNVLIKETAKGYTAKLIDFDAGFLESDPKRGEGVSFDPVFAAPETILAFGNSSIDLTCKIDIFALGLLFHLYATGKMPGLPDACVYASQAILEGHAPALDDSLPQELAALIADMLSEKPEQRPTASTVFLRLNSPDQANGFHPPAEFAGNSRKAPT